MRNIAAINYDPSTAATAATTALLAMTAIDTTNLRHSFTVPASGKVRVVIECTVHGGATGPAILLGVLQSTTVICRVPPRYNAYNLASTTLNRARAEFTITGLTPGDSLTWDAAYSVETLLASTAIKWGGPNNTTANDAFGAFTFEIWDADPFPANFPLTSIDSNGRVDVAKIAGQTASAAGAVTFPDTIASTTNITAGTITTATNLTNLPAMPTDWVSAAGVSAAAIAKFIAGGVASESTLTTIVGVLGDLNDTRIVFNSMVEADGMDFRFTTNALEQAPSGGGGGGTDWTADERTAIRSILGIPGSGTTPADPSAGILDTIRDAVGVVDGVADSILADTAEIGAAGAGLTALAQASAWTAPRAAFLDKLNITGNVASEGAVTNIQNNTRMVFVVPEQIIRPASGTTTNYVRLYLYDSVGNMEAPDSAPEMELRNVAGTDLSARLTSTTGTLESTGVYRWEYTSATAHALEQILWSVTVVEGGNTRRNGRTSWIAETYTTDFTTSDRTTLNAIAGYVDSIPADVRTELSTELGRIDLAISSRLATAGYTAPDNASITSIKAKTDNLPATPAATGDIPTTAQIADKVLGRAIAGSSDGGRTVGQALATLRNKVAFETPGAGQFTVFADDDTTPLWTGTYTATSGASPVTAIDPA